MFMFYNTKQNLISEHSKRTGGGHFGGTEPGCSQFGWHAEYEHLKRKYLNFFCNLKVYTRVLVKSATFEFSAQKKCYECEISQNTLCKTLADLKKL